MAIAELPITSEYLPEWKTWEGLREVIQNALDEETQHEHTAKVVFDDENCVVTVTNKDATLDPRAFLFGHTTKAQDARTIGKYGEGLKLGVLALVREGYKVEIDVGADLWKARFLNSRKYKAKILAFDIAKGVNPDNKDVTVRIEGVSASDYFTAIKRFLHFYPGTVRREGGNSYYGYVLPEGQFRGKVFVKGVWVLDSPDLEFGYDFGATVDLNRDRNLLSDFDISWAAAHILSTVLASKDCSRDIVIRVYNLLERQEGIEVQRLSNDLCASAKEKLAGVFRERHGEKAVPVQDVNGVKQAEFFGAQAVVATPAMVDTLGGVEGMEMTRLAENSAVETEYVQADLPEEARAKLADACDLISLVVTVKPSEIRIVDFDDRMTLGLHVGGQVFIARKILDRPLWKVIEVVCHEAMHLIGGDGSRSHVDGQTAVLSKVIASLWGADNAEPEPEEASN